MNEDAKKTALRMIPLVPIGLAPLAPYKDALRIEQNAVPQHRILPIGQMPW